MASYTGRVLVYGGRGALGAAIVQYFKQQSWWVVSVDFVSNSDAHANVVLESSESWLDQDSIVKSRVSEVVGEYKIDAILCVAGGWAGGNAGSEDFVKNSDMMWKQSVWTSVIAASLAANHLKDGGLLVLTGAQAALCSTPGMIGYGLAKAAVHQLVKSLGQPEGGLPKDAAVAAILPVTLDTPMNRKFMATSDFSKWTPLETVAKLLYDWTTGNNRPKTGSLVQLLTHDGATELVIA